MNRQNLSNSRLLLIALALAAFLRFYRLDSFPVSTSWDEASIGYNAFSISSTARDEYGIKMPLLFKSFNDFKLPGYIYLDALAVKLFGLSTTAVRAPSALLGTLAILAIYLISKTMFGEKVAVISAFLLAISPWHLQFSRAAFESNAALAVVLAGIALLFLGFKKRTAALISVPIVCLSLYFYYSPRIFVPVILVAFLAIYKKDLKKNLKYYLVGSIIALLVSLPIVYKTLSKEGQKRVREVSIFADQSLAKDYVNSRLVHNDLIGRIFLNQRIPYVLGTLKGYSNHFSPTFLFFAQDPNPRHRAAAHGNMYFFEAVTILLGLIALSKKNFPNKKFVLVWLLAAPIAAAPAVDTPHSLRALLMLPPWIMISAIGINGLIKNKTLKPILLATVLVLLINYLVNYYILSPQKDSQSWAYGYEQVFAKLKDMESGADTIIFTGHYWKPYIFYLYFDKIDPLYYQAHQNQNNVGIYHFFSPYWDGGSDIKEADIESMKEGSTLLVFSPQEYEALQDKKKFSLIETVYDYSRSNSLFLIGRWQ